MIIEEIENVVFNDADVVDAIIEDQVLDNQKVDKIEKGDKSVSCEVHCGKDDFKS